MIKRKIDSELQAFMQSDRRSLLVTGARQVGKTFSIRQAAKECIGPLQRNIPYHAVFTRNAYISRL